MIAAVIVIWLVMVVTIGIVAANKNRNVVGWVLAGCWLPLVLVPLAFCLTLDPNDRRQSKPMATKVKT